MLCPGIVWKFDPKISLGLSTQNSYSARVNRGAAVWNGKIYVGTGDCRLFAIDAGSGLALWASPICDPAVTGTTGAPHVAKGKIFIGYNGSDDEIRGSLVAFDAETGKEAWRFWTVPGDPAERFRNQGSRNGCQDLDREKWWRFGGGDIWDPITYDPVTGLLLFGTSRAGVGEGTDSQDDTPGGDKLFSGCIVAVNADSWRICLAFPDQHAAFRHRELPHHSCRPCDQWRKTACGDDGAEEWFLLCAGCKTGQFIAGNPLVKVPWAAALDPTSWTTFGNGGREARLDGAQLVAHEL